MSDINNKLDINFDNKYGTMAFIVKKNRDKDIYDVVVDAGHGGADEGAYGNGYDEIDFTVEYAKLLLDKLNRENKKEILVLGRCNHDLSVVYKGEVINNSFLYKNLKIKYLTVHTSKGLESEEVIVLNVSDDLLGFPNKLEDVNL